MVFVKKPKNPKKPIMIMILILILILVLILILILVLGMGMEVERILRKPWSLHLPFTAFPPSTAPRKKTLDKKSILRYNI